MHNKLIEIGNNSSLLNSGDLKEAEEDILRRNQACNVERKLSNSHHPDKATKSLVIHNESVIKGQGTE